MSLPDNARDLIRSHAKKHVKDNPAGETDREWITRANRTQVRLSAALSAAVNAADLYELLYHVDMLRLVECGTHDDLVRNTAQTVDNTLELTERITAQINRTIDALLASLEPLSRTDAA